MDLVFYNKNGRPIAYLYGEYIYLFNGQPVAYIFENSYVYSFKGKHLGWFDDGWIIDLQGLYVFFTDNAFGGPLKPLKQLQPLRSLRRMVPIKYMREMKRLKPLKRLAWSSNSDESFFQNP